MTDYFSICGIVLGLICLFALLIAVIKFNRPKPSLSEGLVIFLSASAISAGIKVCTLAFNTELINVADGERLYIFIGGLAVAWISCDAIWKIVTIRN